MSARGADNDICEGMCGSSGSLCETTMAMGARGVAVVGETECLGRERGVVVWWEGTHNGKWVVGTTCDIGGDSGGC